MDNSVQLEERLSKRNLWGYSMGGIGRDMTYQLVNTYLLSFILFTKGVTVSQFSAISIIMICCRIFDGLNDPFMGTLIERTRTKLGKFKPWILIGMFTNIAVIMALFWVPLKGLDYVIFFAFGYLMWGITFTMNDISYWGMLPSLTSNDSDRNNLSTLANVGAGIGSALAMLAIPTLTAGDLTLGGNAVTAYGIISAIVCCVFILCQLETCLVVKEKPLPPKGSMADTEHTTIKGMFSTIKGNDQLKYTAVSMLFYNVGSAIMLGLSSYFIYFRYGYQGTLVTVFTVLSGATAAFMVFYPLLAKKMTREKIAKLSLGLILFGYVMLLIVGLLWTDKTAGLNIGTMHIPYNFIVLALCGAFASVGHVSFYMVLTIAITNTVEYNEYNTGKRQEGIIFAIRPLMAKLGSACQVGIVSLILVSLSLVSYTNAISAQENLTNMGSITEAVKTANIADIIAQVPSYATKWLIVCMSVIPLILLTIGIVFWLKKYNISEVRYKEICTVLAQRRAAEYAVADGTGDEAAMFSDVDIPNNPNNLFGDAVQSAMNANEEKDEQPDEADKPAADIGGETTEDENQSPAENEEDADTSDKN